jgi:DNA-binding transcriptional ArsR family regulator
MTKESIPPQPTDPVPGANFQPAEILTISTPEQLKAISDPLRLNIIELVAKEALTVKQIAVRLNQPPTKLYYHVAELEEYGFVTLVDTRVKSGIIEKYYRAVSAQITVDRKLLNVSGAQGDELSNLMTLVFDTTVRELSQSIACGLVDLEQEANDTASNFILLRILIHLRREEATRFAEKFKALLEELAAGNAQPEPDDVSYACLIAFYPRQSLTGQEAS